MAPMDNNRAGGSPTLRWFHLMQSGAANGVGYLYNKVFTGNGQCHSPRLASVFDLMGETCTIYGGSVFSISCWRSANMLPSECTTAGRASSWPSPNNEAVCKSGCISGWPRHLQTLKMKRTYPGRWPQHHSKSHRFVRTCGLKALVSNMCGGNVNVRYAPGNAMRGDSMNAAWSARMPDGNLLARQPPGSDGHLSICPGVAGTSPG